MICGMKKNQKKFIRVSSIQILIKQNDQEKIISDYVKILMKNTQEKMDLSEMTLRM